MQKCTPLFLLSSQDVRVTIPAPRREQEDEDVSILFRELSATLQHDPASARSANALERFVLDRLAELRRDLRTRRP